MAGSVEVLRMSADLRLPLGPPDWPRGIVVSDWQPESAREVHQLLVQAYSQGGGSVADFDTWEPAFTGDPEFEPSLCLLAWAGSDLAGVALGWSSDFLKDLCVAEPYRRQGLGEALVRGLMVLYANRGASTLTLKIEADNPSGAFRLYRRCGFQVVERIRTER